MYKVINQILIIYFFITHLPSNQHLNPTFHYYLSPIQPFISTWSLIFIHLNLRINPILQISNKHKFPQPLNGMSCNRPTGTNY